MVPNLAVISFGKLLVPSSMPPPAIVAPVTPLATVFDGSPPITLVAVSPRLLVTRSTRRYGSAVASGAGRSASRGLSVSYAPVAPPSRTPTSR